MKGSLDRKLSVILLLTVLVLVLEAGWLALRLRDWGRGPGSGSSTGEALRKPAAVKVPEHVGYPEAGPELDTSEGVAQPDSGRVRIALVIDDFGYQWDTAPVQGLLGEGIPLTVAVIPGEWASRRTAEFALSHGKEVLIHLPMEPDHADPNMEKEMLRSGMSGEEVESFISRAAESVPGAVGLNNHMGSAATTDSVLMKALAERCALHGWYILDSITHPGSVLYSEAVRAGVPAVKRDVFLDHTDNPADIRAALAKAVRIALQTGRPAVAVGHPRPATWEVLRVEIPRLTAEGVEWIPLSDAVN